jgi:hypothetical protein
MATSTSRRAHPRRAIRAKSASVKKKIVRAVKSARAKPAVHRRAKPAKVHRPAPKHSVGLAATAVLKSFAKLLRSLTADAAHLTDEQRLKLKKAMKRAHAALD